ncbi:uncharacterized protein LOC112032180 [Quercus suber]|uniref:uncharacterized protein LOC112032180 n=1 Tax=Quercus suber TaxID=58331 RepID=UPI0032DF1905
MGRNQNKKKNKNKKRNDEARTPLQPPPTIFDTIEVPTPLQSLPTIVDTIEAPTTPSPTTSSDDSDEAASTIFDAYDLLPKMRWGSFKRKSHFLKEIIAKTDFIPGLHHIVTPQGNLSNSICITDDEGSVQIPKELVEDSRVKKG